MKYQDALDLISKIDYVSFVRTLLDQSDNQYSWLYEPNGCNYDLADDFLKYGYAPRIDAAERFNGFMRDALRSLVNVAIQYHQRDAVIYDDEVRLPNLDKRIYAFKEFLVFDITNRWKRASEVERETLPADEFDVGTNSKLASVLRTWDDAKWRFGEQGKKNYQLFSPYTTDGNDHRKRFTTAERREAAYLIQTIYPEIGKILMPERFGS